MIKKQTLYIIGNGFDLYHWGDLKLNTSYQCFRDFLEQNYLEAYDLFLEYFPLDGNWGNFESALAEMDMENLWDDLINNYIDDTDPHRSGEASWEAKKCVDLLTVQMREALKEFINGTSKRNGVIQYPQNIDEKRFPLSENALYLSFNYTDTLERYYNISASNICYIHGKASAEDDLIIGHGVEPTELVAPQTTSQMLEGLSPEQQEAWCDQMNDEYSWSGEMAQDELDQYWQKSFKDTSKIISENKTFFDSCKQLEKIVIIGHSLSEVDMPYFEEIKKMTRNNSVWKISFHDNNKKPYLKKKLLSLGVLDSKITFFKL